MTINILKTSYLHLPDFFFTENSPHFLKNPYRLQYNTALANFLNLSESLEHEVDYFSGNFSYSNPISLAYAGHQFGHYVPLLGDGRAHIVGEIHHQDQIFDVQLKGSGRTQFSRNGDGKAPLSSVLREYLVSEAMFGLGISTTRSLAVVATEETIYRQEGLVPQGVLTRIAQSHIRVGTFQYAYHNGGLKELADYTIARLYPELVNHPEPYLIFFKNVLENQARLIAQWQSVGFIHGVMNTDNMAISGETLDYGPCAFLDEFDANCVFSSIDHHARYAYGNQPTVALWNLMQLGQSLLPLLTKNKHQAVESINAVLNTFYPSFQNNYYQLMQRKLGLNIENANLIEDLIKIMQQTRADYTLTFSLLTRSLEDDRALLPLTEMLGGKNWIERWLACIDKQVAKQTMPLINPIYIARNHLVEKAINNILNDKNRELFDLLLKVFANPYEMLPDTSFLQKGPSDKERVLHTFCGT